ncbi:MAG TPA: phosphate acyltransferase PlsX [Cytophagales bacterium]|nr:phosphate acyltransferase PlsX [Cytophagales bacterium]
MKIALDAMGGDFAPDAVIEGVALALKEISDSTIIVLTGKTELIKEKLNQFNIPQSAVEIVEAPEVIEMGEHPTKALTQKPNSSIAVGFGLLKMGKVQAFCSAGNTGAMMVGALFSVKAIEGIQRPALISFVPKEDGDFGVLIDVGANSDCKPEQLVQFGQMGSIYAKYIYNIDKPKVGLMNLGEEEQKGTVLTQAAHQLLKAAKDINFIGNIEGRDLYNRKADVIVCDGFTGNIILKMAENMHDLLAKRNISDPFFEKFNYENIGGSPILGVNANVIIGHGVSSGLAIKNMIHQAVKMNESDMSNKIKTALTKQTNS